DSAPLERTEQTACAREKRAIIRSVIRRCVAFAFALLLAAAAARAEDWPEFRGPTGQGHSSERGLPLEWSETRNIVWNIPVPGAAWSSPVGSGGRVWLTTAVKGRGGSLRVLAFDVATGREPVNTEVFRPHHSEPLNPKNTLASPTPVVEGERVYVHF